MSPRSLLFSSDLETSRRLTQVLHELDFEVESCAEIFVAVEKITARKFDLIVADWDDGQEASFLLKTSRELKLSADAVTAAVTGNLETTAAAHRAGATIVLSKPVIIEQGKFELLSSDAFLQGLRTWIPELAGSTESFSRIVGTGPHLISSSDPISTDLSKGTYPEDDLDDWDEAEIPPPPSLYLVRGSNAGDVAGKLGGKHWPRLISFACALGIALSSAGYLFSAPTRSDELATSVQQVYEKVVHTTDGLLKNPAAEGRGNLELAQANIRPAHRETSAIRVTEVHEYVEPSPVPKQAQPQSEPQPEPPLPVVPQPEYRSVAMAIIPDSLKTPGESMRSVAARITPTLLGGFEPVNVSADLAAQLLLQRIDPSYPQKALQAGLQGPVVFEAWISRDGSIRDLKLIRGSLLLGQAAYSAVKQWRYKPYLLNGQAVETETYVTVNFMAP